MTGGAAAGDHAHMVERRCGPPRGGSVAGVARRGRHDVPCRLAGGAPGAVAAAAASRLHAGVAELGAGERLRVVAGITAQLRRDVFVGHHDVGTREPGAWRVAAGAIARRALEHAELMARFAALRDVGSGQREAGLEVVEAGLRRLRDGRTGGAYQQHGQHGVRDARGDRQRSGQLHGLRPSLKFTCCSARRWNRLAWPTSAASAQVEPNAGGSSWLRLRSRTFFQSLVAWHCSQRTPN